MESDKWVHLVNFHWNWVGKKTVKLIGKMNWRKLCWKREVAAPPPVQESRLVLFWCAAVFAQVNLVRGNVEKKQKGLPSSTIQFSYDPEILWGNSGPYITDPLYVLTTVLLMTMMSFLNNESITISLQKPLMTQYLRSLRRSSTGPMRVIEIFFIRQSCTWWNLFGANTPSLCRQCLEQGPPWDQHWGVGLNGCLQRDRPTPRPTSVLYSTQ